jgi:hypothetical protein
MTDQQGHTRSYSSPPPDTPLSGQQLQALQKAAGERFNRVMSDIELRKWALSEAVKVNQATSTDVMGLAERIHEFLVKPAVKDAAAD